MNLDGPLAAFAAYGQRLHTATATITRPGATEAVYDPDANTYTDPDDEPVHTGPCSVLPTGGERVVEFGDGPVTLRTYDVTLDGPVAGIRVGDNLALSETGDPKLDGAALEVLDVVGSSMVTNRRLVCEERLV